MNKKYAILLISGLAIVAIAVAALLFFSTQKTTYYGYMENSTKAEKVVSEKTNKVTKDVKIENSKEFKPKKGDFVKLISNDDGKTFYKKEIVSHDDIPHGLMMKIHEMKM
ncbi:DUF4889 domain-containing protein [Mammaliicoccus stepanovicii]|uniref:DUF4889 domain-containing protein n=1 Tax=Mammaliicoccus stepanovicii TaxID=643214 RepID=A0A239YAZ1_9STAP|nr:DUF4889 domain-containing protein [Mammaliicoccus stepanovicii]PNZ75501.1 DUF4889 domain-containing protein [Mammaliicoccus stepanovicii]GGI42541.1 DUF4889 domain-containing protein [Mammaliicoccus stepanovicii]SNV56215.1 Uncharacterised protein [Mammaliicoccus stepanovicii]